MLRGLHWRQYLKTQGLRRRYLNEVNDPALRPKPTGKSKKRGEKRRPGKPGRRM